VRTHLSEPWTANDHEGVDDTYQETGYALDDGAIGDSDGAHDPWDSSDGWSLSPALVRRFDAGLHPHPNGHSAALMIALTRDPAPAVATCPRSGPLLSWRHRVGVSLRSSSTGMWTRYSHAYGLQPEPPTWGDLAQVDLGTESLASWRFEPDEPGPFAVWAFVFVDGVFRPFDATVYCAHTVDANGALRLDVA
jgi:hypothetical protein